MEQTCPARHVHINSYLGVVPNSLVVLSPARLPAAVLGSLLIRMAEGEARLAAGCSERVELAALIAAFQVARDHVTAE